MSSLPRNAYPGTARPSPPAGPTARAGRLAAALCLAAILGAAPTGAAEPAEDDDISFGGYGRFQVKPGFGPDPGATDRLRENLGFPRGREPEDPCLRLQSMRRELLAAGYWPGKVNDLQARVLLGRIQAYEQTAADWKVYTRCKPNLTDVKRVAARARFTAQAIIDLKVPTWQELETILQQELTKAYSDAKRLEQIQGLLEKDICYEYNGADRNRYVTEQMVGGKLIKVSRTPEQYAAYVEARYGAGTQSTGLSYGGSIVGKERTYFVAGGIAQTVVIPWPINAHFENCPPTKIVADLSGGPPPTLTLSNGKAFVPLSGKGVVRLSADFKIRWEPETAAIRIRAVIDDGPDGHLKVYQLKASGKGSVDLPFSCSQRQKASIGKPKLDFLADADTKILVFKVPIFWIDIRKKIKKQLKEKMIQARMQDAVDAAISRIRVQSGCSPTPPAPSSP